jgi:hypothetical protein
MYRVDAPTSGYPERPRQTAVEQHDGRMRQRVAGRQYFRWWAEAYNSLDICGIQSPRNSPMPTQSGCQPLPGSGQHPGCSMKGTFCSLGRRETAVEAVGLGALAKDSDPRFVGYALGLVRRVSRLTFKRPRPCTFVHNHRYSGPTAENSKGPVRLPCIHQNS